MVETSAAARWGYESGAVTAAARDALLDLLATEMVPVFVHLRLTAEGTAVLGRASPGRGTPKERVCLRAAARALSPHDPLRRSRPALGALGRRRAGRPTPHTVIRPLSGAVNS